jgi:drug/metabolite transporter (DMT)-like permease
MNYACQYSDRHRSSRRTLTVVTILALAAAVLYGTADFLGGVASRRANVFAVLVTTAPAGAVVVIVVALLSQAPWLGGVFGQGPGSPTSFGGWGAFGWAAASGVCGAAGLIAFYAGFAAAPISVVSPVAALASAVLPVGVAVAGGERLTAAMAVGGLICLVAIVLVSMPGPGPEDQKPIRPNESTSRPGSSRLRGLGYGVAAGAGFGLFFLCLKNAGQSGVLWPVAISRTAGTVVAVGIALVAGVRPWRRSREHGGGQHGGGEQGGGQDEGGQDGGGQDGGGQRGMVGIALVSGAVDAAANVCYVLATRSGLFGLAVVITALYPGMTVLLARWVLGERMRWIQRAGLLLAAVGVVLLTLLSPLASGRP